VEGTFYESDGTTPIAKFKTNNAAIWATVWNWKGGCTGECADTNGRYTFLFPVEAVGKDFDFEVWIYFKETGDQLSNKVSGHATATCTEPGSQRIFVIDWIANP